MHSIRLPNTCTIDITLDACTSTLRDQELKAYVDSVRDVIIQRSKDYEDAGLKAELFDFPQDTQTGCAIDRKKMEALYSKRLVKCAAGRPIYKLLMLGGIQGKCAICSERDAQTLDHYLPKSTYASLAVTPVNLVPACSTCNTSKSSTLAKSADTMFLHPYFDQINDIQWLNAEYTLEQGLSFRFFVDEKAVRTASTPIGNADILATRLTNMFTSCKLNSMYSQKASTLISSLEDFVTCTLAETNGPKLLREATYKHINFLTYTKRKNFGINYWETVLYSTLLSDSRFMDGLPETAMPSR